MTKPEPPKFVPKGLKRCGAEGCLYLALSGSEHCVQHQVVKRG